MESNEIKVYFSINYNTSFGENIYLVGDIPLLGNWDPSKGYPLNYHQGGEWSGMVRLPRLHRFIEYKYVVYDPEKKKAIWEDGENRYLEPRQMNNTKEDFFMRILQSEIIFYFLDEVWNHREVNVRIKYDCAKGITLAICGDGQPLGNWKNPVHMNVVSKKDPLTGKRTTYWQKIFHVKHDCKRIKYRFVICDLETEEKVWEREPDRVCNFVTLSTNSPYKDYDSNPNKKDCIKFARKQNKFIKYDVNFVAELHYNQITENIIIGPYPQSSKEIEHLAMNNIKAVLNLQTKTDMKYRSIDWHEIKNFYKNNNMAGKNFPITDMNPDDMAFKAYDAATYLNELVKQHRKVYVHCTAGIGRAPHTVAAYLIFYENYTVDDAIKLVKEKRPVSYLIRDVLWKAYLRYKGQEEEVDNCHFL